MSDDDVQALGIAAFGLLVWGLCWYWYGWVGLFFGWIPALLAVVLVPVVIVLSLVAGAAALFAWIVAELFGK